MMNEHDNKVFELINDLNVSIEEFAMDTNIHPERVKAALCNEIDFTEEECKNICEVYEVSPDYFPHNRKSGKQNQIKESDEDDTDWRMTAGEFIELKCNEKYRTETEQKPQELMTVGERIQFIRKHLDMSLQEFGKPLGVTRGTICHLELGRRQVTEQMKKSICNAYKVNSEWLDTGIGDMQSEVSHAEKATLMSMIDEMDEAANRRLISFLISCINEKIKEDDFDQPVHVVEKICRILNATSHE